MKKGLKILFILLGIIVALGLIFFAIDYNIVQKQKKPIFCIQNPAGVILDGGTIEYFGFGYKVIDFHTLAGYDDIKIGTWFMNYNDFGEEMKVFEEKYDEQKELNNQKYVELENVDLDYNFTQMVEDKCYIVTNSNTVYHIEELDKFIENAKNKIPDEIRIVQYTIEGQPILTNLEYINNKFILKVDNRRDGYAAEEDRKITTKEYDATEYELVKGNTPNVITNLKTYYSVELKGKGIRHTISICSYAEIKQTTDPKFKIQFNADSKDENITKILGKEENDKYDYDIYSYKGTVDIIVDGERMSLREALINNKITIDEILEKAKKDAKIDNTIFGDVYLDGGSSFYVYNDYQILKCNIISAGVGNDVSYIKDVYIGVPSMYIGDIKKMNYENDIDNKTENFTFIKTYNVINVDDSNDENYIYLTIRQFQEEEVKTVKVQRSLANSIEEKKDYEFTFKYTDKIVEDNIESIFTNTEIISIKKTDKQGLEQIQDSIR